MNVDPGLKGLGAPGLICLPRRCSESQLDVRGVEDINKNGIQHYTRKVINECRILFF